MIYSAYYVELYMVYICHTILIIVYTVMYGVYMAYYFNFSILQLCMVYICILF